MRIRKAVPAGYQTRKAMELEQGQWNSSTAPMLRRSAKPANPPLSRSHELQPYCSVAPDAGNAMHDIGGCGMQPRSDASAADGSPSYGLDHDKENDMPSSQDSNSSTESMPHNKGKRGWDDEDEGDPVVLHRASETDALRVMMSQRIWARSRGRTARRRRTASMAAPIPAVNVLDFDEAKFLCAREECMDLT